MTSEDLVPQPFLDWYDIWPGASGYEPDGRAWVSDAPHGVQLTVQPAEKSAPFFVPEKPWEAGSLSHLNVRHEDGRYRMWYGAHAPGEGAYLLYAESEDGVHWERPVLGLHEFKGSKENNIVLPGQSGESIFVDPSAPAAERYKLLGGDAWFTAEGAMIDGAAGMARLGEGLETQIDGMVRGFVSPDGLHWTAIDEPLMRLFADTQNIAFYDEGLGRYVGFFRQNMFRDIGAAEWPPNTRRCVGRSETTDFRHWPRPRIVLQPDSQDPPTDDFYTSGYCQYPGGRYHLMFPALFHRVQDTLDLQLATSRDGLTWTRPQRVPIVSLDPGEQALYSSPEFVPLGDDRWGIPYLAIRQPHNAGFYLPEEAGDGVYRWASWPRDRLVALEAPVEGRVTLLARRCQGEQLVLNYRTEPGGWVKAELIGPESHWPPAHAPALTGHTFADCTALRGDSLAEAVRWGESADLAHLKGRPLCVRIELVRAQLFAVSL